MACIIKRNEEGKILDVQTPTGIKSELFAAVHSIPYLADTETSLSVFKNAYTDKVEKMFEKGGNTYNTGEPKLFFRSEAGKVYDSVEEALIDNASGTMQAGFRSPSNEEFLPIVEFNTEASENSRFVTSAVRQGMMSAERILMPDGETRFQGKGNYEVSKKATARLAHFEYAVTNGRHGVKLHGDGTFSIKDSGEFMEVVNEDGTKSSIRVNDIPQLLSQSNPQNKVDLIVAYMIDKKYLESSEEAQDNNSEDLEDIATNLMYFLESLGFTTTMLENYKKNYNTKYGQDPDVKALADMANRVVAFAQGDLTIESLSEEVAHIAIEFYADQNSIASALANVHLTPEYKQHASFYRSKYAKNYKGVELEDQVRREVLGKILKNEFKSRFNKEGKSQERQYLIDRLIELWENFSAFISGRVRFQHIQDISELTVKIADSVFERQMQDFDSSKESENFYYDAMDTTGKEAEGKLRGIKNQLEILFQRSLKEPLPSQQELDKIVVGMEQTNIVRSVNSIVGVTNSQVKILEAAVRQSLKDGRAISNKDQMRFYTVASYLETINSLKLDVAKMSLENPGLKTLTEGLVDSIKELNDRVLTIKPQIDEFKAQRAEELLEEVLEFANLSETEKDKVRESFHTVEKDTNFLGLNFGLISQSSNAVLALIARKVKDMHTNVTMALKGRADQDINTISAKGLQKFQSGVIQKDKNGKATYYYRSPYMMHEYETDRLEKEADIIVELTGEDRAKVLTALKTNAAHKVINNEAKYKEYSKAIREWDKTEGLEQRVTEAYELKKEERYTKADISDATREVIANKNRARFERDRKYRNADGSIDSSKKTEQERTQDIDDKQNYKKLASPYFQGQIREGLTVQKASEMTADQLKALGIDPTYLGDVVMVDSTYTKDTLPEDARISLDLFNLNMVYRNELKDQSRSGQPTEKFVETLQQLEEEGGSAAYEWMMANSSLSLSSAFFESMDTGAESYSDLVKKWMRDISDPELKKEISANLAELDDLQRNRKSFLAIYRKPNNPVETSANEMTTVDHQKIRKLDAEIKSVRNAIGLPQEYYEGQVMASDLSVRDVNEDFELMRQEQGLSVYDFALLHMTDYNSEQTKKFASQLEKYMKGKSAYIQPNFKDFYDNLLADRKVDTSLPIEEQISVVKGEFAKSRVASYYQRFEPRGYAQAVAAMKDGSLKISELFNEESRARLNEEYKGLNYLEITPDYTWTQDINNSEFNNPNYVQGTYYKQPKLSKYINKDGFFDHYGITVEAWKASNDNINLLKATKNQEEFELLQILTRLREESLAEYGDSEKVSKYLRPQVSRSKMELIVEATTSTRTLGAIKESIRDITQERVDEKLYGEESESGDLVGSGKSAPIKAIPKYFQTKLENPEVLTDNLIQAAFLDFKEAKMYTQRSESEADMNALLYKLSDQKYKASGGKKSSGLISKKGQTSNYYQKGQEYLDYMLYGIKQTRRMETQILGKTVDLTRVVNALQSWTRFSNLAYNFIVDATSGTTGLLVNLSDRFSGEFYHSSSANRANTLAMDVFKYIAEEGKLNKTSELNHMMELFGSESVDERLSNSGFGRTMRLVDSSPYLVSKISNMGIKPHILMSNLVDIRFIEGGWRSYPEFFNYMKSKNKETDKKTIESMFKQAKKESVYDHLDIKKTGITFNSKFKEKFGENAAKEFEDLVKKVSAKNQNMVQIVDTVISQTDQLKAQRDVLSNTLMMHKGWLPINLTKRWKREHFNFMTNQVEEGHYTTLFKYISNSVKSKSMVKAYKELDFEGRSNVKRVMYETGMLIGIFLLGMAIFAGDDDDDSALEDVMQYVFLRTSSEFNSATLFGMSKSVVDVAKSPITAISTVELLEPISLLTNILSFDTEVYSKTAKKLSPLKRLDQWEDIQKQMNSYWHFNKRTIPLYHPIKDKRSEELKEKKRLKEQQLEALKLIK